MNNRIIYSDNGTLNDFSVELNKYKSGSQAATIVAAEDYIYVGSRAPFNHFYAKLGANTNGNSSNMIVDYWEGKEWVAMVEVIDETDGFSQSGYITFTPDLDEGWTRESTNFRGDQITGLTDVVIYDLYWIRISLDADTTAIDFDWFGQIFSEDDDLAAEYPQLVRSDYFLAFDSTGSKTDWQEQHAKAGEFLAKDMIARGIITHKENIITREELKLASVSKVAEFIFTALGDDYEDDRDKARNEYLDRINKSIFRVDTNDDAYLSVQEDRLRQGFMRR